MPPNIAEVEQKLQPTGQPTDGMTVAAMSPAFSGAVTPTRARAVAGDDLRVTDGLLGVFAQERAEPADPFALDNVVGVDPLGEIGNVGDVPAHDDLGLGKVLADQLAHLLHLQRGSARCR